MIMINRHKPVCHQQTGVLLYNIIVISLYYTHYDTITHWQKTQAGRRIAVLRTAGPVAGLRWSVAHRLGLHVPGIVGRMVVLELQAVVVCPSGILTTWTRIGKTVLVHTCLNMVQTCT